jgi:hypothetical protein
VAFVRNFSTACFVGREMLHKMASTKHFFLHHKTESTCICGNESSIHVEREGIYLTIKISPMEMGHMEM